MISSNMRSCPVCSTLSSGAKLFINQNIDLNRLSTFSFASRKVPEYMCHEMVRCQNCDVVYACTPPDLEDLAEAYHTASYDSTEEANDAAQAYITAIEPVLNFLQSRDIALEIGTGTGIFLEHLQSAGFKKLIGVEPSSAAIEAAPESRRHWIRQGMFDEKEFEPGSIDLICCFMTLEHVRDPHRLTEAALRLLKPGGAFVTVTHDYRSFVNKILGKRSPIIDIEHLQIFSHQSIRELFQRSGFEKVKVNSFQNKYSLRYWIRLSPLPLAIKNIFNSIATRPPFRNIKISLNVGNTIAFGFRPN